MKEKPRYSMEVSDAIRSVRWMPDFRKIPAHTGLFIIALLCAVHLGPVSVAWAAKPPNAPPEGASAESMRVSPTKFEILIKPGQESNASIKIRNGTKDTMKVTLSAWNFVRDDQGAAQRLPMKDETNFRGAASWIEHTRKPITLEVNEETATIINVRAPKKTALGSYSTYLRIIGARKSQDRESLQVRFVVDALVLPIVLNKSHIDSRSMKTKVKFGGISTEGFLLTSLPFKITAKVRNKGNVHQNFEGAISIWQGKVRLKRIPLKRTLLPEATSTFIGSVDELPYFGKLTAKFSGSAFMAKSFRKQNLKGQVTVWYIPALFIYILGGIVLLLFIAVSFFLWRRVIKTKKKPDDPGPDKKQPVSGDL